MPTEIRYQDSMDQYATHLMGFCRDAPRDVLKELFRSYPVTRYESITSPFGHFAKGFSLETPTEGLIPRGLSPTADISDLLPEISKMNVDVIPKDLDYLSAVRKSIYNEIRGVAIRGKLVQANQFSLSQGIGMIEGLGGMRSVGSLANPELILDLSKSLTHMQDLAYAVLDIQNPTNRDLIEILRG